MTISNTQNLESAPLSACWCISTADGVANRDTIERPPIKIVCKCDTAALLAVTKDIACADCCQQVFQHLHEPILTAHGSGFWSSRKGRCDCSSKRQLSWWNCACSFCNGECSCCSCATICGWRLATISEDHVCIVADRDIQCLVQDRYSRCIWSPLLMLDRRQEQRLCGLRGEEERLTQIQPEVIR